jgi:hypothetical protein
MPVVVFSEVLPTNNQSQGTQLFPYTHEVIQLCWRQRDATVTTQVTQRKEDTLDTIGLQQHGLSHESSLPTGIC